MPASSTSSLERKLPLLISVVLVLLAAGLTAAGYQEVKQASELRGVERLQRMASQLGQLASGNIALRYAALRRVASDTAVVRFLAGRDDGAEQRQSAIAALSQLELLPSDTAIIAQLRSSREAIRASTGPEASTDNGAISALVARLSNGQPAMGELYIRADTGFYWVGAPVGDAGRIVGYVIQRRAIVPNARTEETIRELAGNDKVSIYLTSDSAPRWASLSGGSTPAAVVSQRSDDAANVVRYTRHDTSFVGVNAPVTGSVFRIVAETPYDALMERPAMFLRRSIIVALAMLAVAIVAAWVLSRRITRPLRDLTTAADAISMGDYGHRARVAGGDEIGRLAEAFNLMAGQVQRSHEDLEEQVEQSRTLAARLTEANRAKADFLATMSHELRTPLNAIGGYVDLMELGVRGDVTEEQKRDLERIRYNQRHLLTLIGNILDFTRLDADKLPFDIEDVHVDRVVHGVLTALAPLLTEKSLRAECLGCDVPVVARADRARLDQILLNLLSNAVRFTPAGGTITAAVEQRDEQVTVTVRDTGIGIPTEKLAAIFEPFVQVESGLTRTVGGTGLGLTISRGLARGMGGDLTAESDGASWAAFTLTLPIAVASEAARRDMWTRSGHRSGPVAASPIA